MALTTLANLKTHLGIDVSDTSEDAALVQWLAAASSAIRTKLKGRWLGEVVSAISLANPTVIECVGHTVETGDSLTFAHSNSTPTIDGARTATRINGSSFSVPVNVTTAGTSATFAKSFTEFYCGDGTPKLVLSQKPVLSITSIYSDSAGYYGEPAGAFGTEKLLVAGTDYALVRDNNAAPEKSLSGIVARITGVWPNASEKIRGLLSLGVTKGIGNLKVTYVAGYVNIPNDLQTACCNAVGILRRLAPNGASMQSESLDYYSYSLASGAGAAEFGNVMDTLKSYKKWVW